LKSQYKFKDYTFGQLKDEITMPDFQRSLVWKDKQKESFIQTAVEGKPFGVLMLYDDVKSGKLLVIDGLQRFTTLKRYDESPFEFFDISVEKYPEIKRIQEVISEIYDQDSSDSIIKNIISDLKKVVSNHKEIRNTKFGDIVTAEICKNYPYILHTKYENIIFRIVTEMWIRLHDLIDINALTIPAIVFKGEESELPSIFERLNQGGTKLSKYEVFASSWKSILLVGVDRDITERVEKRYISIMEETELEIDGYVEGSIIAQESVSLYEYAFAFGKILKDNNKTLINSSKSKSDDAVDSIGFTTLITFLGKHIKDMSKLKDYINSQVKPSNLSKFKRVILMVYNEVEEILKPYVQDYNKYIESQVLSIVYTWFKINYNFDIETFEATRKTGVDEAIAKFKKYMPFRFINDSLRSFWSGHGDNSLNEVINSDLKHNRYLTPIEFDQWKSHLDEWIEQQMRSSLKNFTSDVKMFYAYVNKLLGYQCLENPYVQYVIPKKMVQSIPAMVPISPLGNIYFLPRGSRSERNTFLPKVLSHHRIDWEYPIMDKLEFMMNDKLDEHTYVSFIIERHKYLIEVFLDNLPT